MIDWPVIQCDAADLAHGDVLGPVDFATTDPPYSPHVHDNTASIRSNADGPVKRDLGFDALTSDLTVAVAKILSTKVARWSVVFSDLEGTQNWRFALGTRAEYVREVPWIRWSQPQLSGDRPPSGAEAVLHFHRCRGFTRSGKVKPLPKWWNGPGSLTHYASRCLRGKDKHPAEKPLDLALDLVSFFSDPGELGLDLFAGAGTFALACRILGRRMISIERDPHWAAYAQTRVLAPLSDRDYKRYLEWIERTRAEAQSVPYPKAKDGSDVKTWERAQRRLADVERAEAWGAQ